MYDTLRCDAVSFLAVYEFEELSFDDAWHFPWKVIKRNGVEIERFISRRRRMMIRLWAEMCREIFSLRRRAVWRGTVPLLCGFTVNPQHKIFSHFHSSRYQKVWGDEREEEEEWEKLHDDVKAFIHFVGTCGIMFIYRSLIFTYFVTLHLKASMPARVVLLLRKTFFRWSVFFVNFAVFWNKYCVTAVQIWKECNCINVPQKLFINSFN